jgi:hypothetical protein
MLARARSSRVVILMLIVEPGTTDPFRRLVTFPVTVRPRGVTWTPDGSALVVAQQEAPSDIVLFELAGQR